MDKLDFKEKMWGGAFGVVAIIAAIVEMFVNGVNSSSIVGMIKDVSGTAVVVILFITIINSLLPKKSVNFKQEITHRMESIKSNYAPLLQEDEKKEGVIRYSIASNIGSLFTETPKGYKRMFELDENNPKEIRFYVNKSFFSKAGGEDFDPETIATTILARLQKNYGGYNISTFKNGENSGILVGFGRTITTKDDIDSLIGLIDYTILLYIAENKS